MADFSTVNNQYKKNTESHLKDKLYNWIIDRYTRNGKPFNFSDRFVWSGAVYTLPEIFGYIIFFAIFYYLGGKIYDKYGYSRLFMFFMLLLIWRVNIATKLMRQLLRDIKN